MKIEGIVHDLISPKDSDYRDLLTTIRDRNELWIIDKEKNGSLTRQDGERTVKGCELFILNDLLTNSQVDYSDLRLYLEITQNSQFILANFDVAWNNIYTLLDSREKLEERANLGLTRTYSD